MSHAGVSSLIHPLHCANLIIPRLYLSDLRTARDEDIVSHFGITHIISILEKPPVFPNSMEHIKRLHIPLEDSAFADLLQHLPETTAFIQTTLDENPDNKILVHCQMGISRSAAVVSAYLIATTNMIPTEAIDFVREKRSIACPNIGFRNQLDTYSMSFYANGQKGQMKTVQPGPNIADRVKRLKGLYAAAHGHK